MAIQQIIEETDVTSTDSSQRRLINLKHWDQRDEDINIIESIFALDRWDLISLKSDFMRITRCTRWIDFSKIDESYKVFAKHYCKHYLFAHGPNTIPTRICAILSFIEFYMVDHEKLIDIKDVNSDVLDKYLENMASRTKANGEPLSPRTLRSRIYMLTAFFRHVNEINGFSIQNYISTNTASALVELDKKKPAKIIITQHILDKIAENIPTLPHCAFLHMLIRTTTKWEPLIILNMRIDSCLEKREDEWWLIGECPKTNKVYEHHINHEFASFIDYHRQWVNDSHGHDYNSDRWLNGAFSGNGVVRPYSNQDLMHNVWRWTRKCGISADKEWHGWSASCWTRYSDALSNILCKAIKNRSLTRFQYIGDRKNRYINSSDSVTVENRSTIDVVPATDFSMEAVLKRDVWDVRRIPTAILTPGRNYDYADFRIIPARFREDVKAMCRTMLHTWSWITLVLRIRQLNYFIQFYIELHPECMDFRDITRLDIECYLSHARRLKVKNNNPPGESYIYNLCSAAKGFVRFLNRTNRGGPNRPIDQLFWPTDVDVAKFKAFRATKVQYLTHHVTRQLDEKFRLMPKWLFTLASIIRVSGWRISDVLNLKTDTCLEQRPKHGGELGWWLVGDISKTRITGHRIPIEDHVAAVILAWIDEVKRNENNVFNPGGYLFVTDRTQSLGRPISSFKVLDAFKAFAIEHNIRDENGTLVILTTKTFRHTKATELLNANVSLAVVQAWLGHSSPEMTLVYAKITEDTMRREFDQAISKGALRIGVNGLPQRFEPSIEGHDETEDYKIEWDYIRHNLDRVRVDSGYCLLPMKLTCQWQEPKCLSCTNFLTTSDFLPDFRKQREEILIQIEIGRKAEQKHWVEKNENRLKPVENIIKTLEDCGTHHPAGKHVREYPASQRAHLQVNG